MLGASVWRKVLGVDRATVIESVEVDEEGDGEEVIVVHVRPRRAAKRRCGRCGRRAPGWASDALDDVRREVWRDARRSGMRAYAKQLQGCRYALWKNPEDLTTRQGAKLAWVAKENDRLYRAYLLKEQLRLIIHTKGILALLMLEEWLAWAQRSRIGAFVELGRKIRRHLKGIEAALIHDCSNALVESTNTKLRVLHRMAFGFARPEHLIALALLDRGGYCPPLPGPAA